MNNNDNSFSVSSAITTNRISLSHEPYFSGWPTPITYYATRGNKDLMLERIQLTKKILAEKTAQLELNTHTRNPALTHLSSIPTSQNEITSATTNPISLSHEPYFSSRQPTPITYYAIRDNKDLILERIQLTKKMLAEKTAQLELNTHTRNSALTHLSSIPTSQNEITSAFEHEAGDDLVYQSIPRDENCLYKAVALHCGQDHQNLRNIVSANILSNLDKYKKLIKDERIFNNSEYTTKYLINLANDIKKGKERKRSEDIAISVLMNLLDRPIIIVDRNKMIENLPYVKDNNVLMFTGKPIFLCKNGSNHYDTFTYRDDISGIDIFNKLKQKTINRNKTLLAELQNNYVKHHNCSF